jgi:predicted TIM-barrel fold metal-dependent hydrolase
VQRELTEPNAGRHPWTTSTMTMTTRQTLNDDEKMISQSRDWKEVEEESKHQMPQDQFEGQVLRRQTSMEKRQNLHQEIQIDQKEMRELNQLIHLQERGQSN